MIVVLLRELFVYEHGARRTRRSLPGKEVFYVESNQFIIPDTYAVKGGH